MADTYTSAAKARKIESGTRDGTWAAPLNDEALELIDDMASGTENINLGTSTSYAMAALSNGADSESRAANLKFTGTPASAVTVTVPASVSNKHYYIENSCGKTLTIKYASGTGVVFGNGDKCFVFCDGSEVYDKGPGYRITAAEIAAGVTPVDYTVPSHDICGFAIPDRYATNTTPGTTDMSTAFSSAYAVAKVARCGVQYGKTAPYLLNGPVNCTQMRGIVTNDVSGKDLSTDSPSVIINHTGHGFDLSASTEMVFNDVIASNNGATIPKTLFFCARNAAGSGAGFHKFNRIRTAASAKFSHVYYGYASEENTFTDCSIYQNQNGSSIFNQNSTNPSSYSSSFLSIATGTQSNSTVRHSGGSYFQLGNSGSANEVIFANEGVSDFTYRDGLWYCPHGLAYANFNGASGTQGVTFDSIRAEPGGGPTPTYGILVNATSGSHINWTISNVQADATNELIYFGDSAPIYNLTLTESASNGKVFNAKNATNVFVKHNTGSVTGRASGAIANSTFIGSKSAVTLSGTDTANTGFDQANGRTWQTAESYSSGTAACTGAITANSSYTINVINRKVTLVLPSLSATATAATNYAYGVAIPSAYRPAANLRIPIIVLDNGGTPNQLGMVIITASTGAINVYKDVLATGNFTAAVGAGLPGTTEVSWTI